MAYRSYFNQAETGNPYSEEMAWDMRQFITRFIALHMMDYYKAEKDNNYPLMLRILNRWHSTVFGKASKTDDKDEDYGKLHTEIIKIANKYQHTWLGKNYNSVGVSEIEGQFNSMKEYLISLMEEYQMFGAKKDLSGL